MKSTRLGAFDLTVVSDGTYFLDGGNFFGIVPKVLWQKRAEPDEPRVGDPAASCDQPFAARKPANLRPNIR